MSISSLWKMSIKTGETLINGHFAFKDYLRIWKLKLTARPFAASIADLKLCSGENCFGENT